MDLLDTGFHQLLPGDAIEWFGDLDVTWWIAGGWALDLAAGGQTREHIDLDVGVFHTDLGYILTQTAGIDFYAARGGRLQELGTIDDLHPSANSLWLKRPGDELWLMELMINHGSTREWVYRRDHRIRVPRGEFLLRVDGLECFRPEIQLLFKSEKRRGRDEADFDVHEPLLSPPGRSWLHDALVVCSPGHPWISRLEKG